MSNSFLKLLSSTLSRLEKASLSELTCLIVDTRIFLGHANKRRSGSTYSLVARGLSELCGPNNTYWSTPGQLLPGHVKHPHNHSLLCRPSSLIRGFFAADAVNFSFLFLVTT
jgi:hypothetical protein